MKFLTLILSFLCLNSLFTQLNGEFDQIDYYARSAPKNIQSIDELVSYFSSRPSSQIEKARLIYVWLTENISYDARAYNLKNPGNNSPSSVFKSKKAVCAGFANLYTEIGKKMGLELETINGFAKGYEYEENINDNLDESINHAWNLIRIDGEWRVFDATWGEGYGTSNKKGKLESTKQFNDFWFNLDPKKAIFSHLPGDVNKQFVHPTISFESYLNLPFLTPDVFDTGWISPDEILSKFHEKKKIDLPNFVSPLSKLKLSAPKDRVLKKGKPHDFILESNEIKNVFIYVNEDEVIPFVADGQKFKYTLNSKSIGTYQLVVSVQNEQLYTILEYVIE